MVKVADIDEFRDIAFTPSNPAHPEALRIIMEACYSMGLTRAELYRNTDMTPKGFSDAINGFREMERFEVEMLASVLGIPELKDGVILPFKTSRYTLTCRMCHRVKSFMASRAKRWHDVQLNENEGTGTYTCNKCTTSARNLKVWETAKKKGKQQAILDRLDEIRPLRDPEKLRENGRRLLQAHRDKNGGHNSEVQNERIAVAKMAPRPDRLLAQCCYCGGWLAMKWSSPGRAMFHGTCWKEWIKKTRGQFNHGKPYTTTNVPRPETMIVVTKGTLIDMWELTWRHVVLDEALDGSSGLAMQFRINRRTAYRWIHLILDHLPPEGIADKWITKRAEILRKYAEAKGLLAQPTKRLVSQVQQCDI